MILNQGPTALASYPYTPDAFLGYVKNLRAKLTGHALLSNPNPTLAVFSAAVDALDQAMTTARDRSSSHLADRNAAALIVAKHVGHLVDYTQGVADLQPSAADAVAVILSAGLQVKKIGSHKKPPLAVKYTGISGAVLIVALAIAGGGAYYWEYSLDQKVWTSVPETRQFQTTIAGLTPGQVYYFRFRALTKQGKSDYSQVVSLMMH